MIQDSNTERINVQNALQYTYRFTYLHTTYDYTNNNNVKISSEIFEKI